MEEDDLILRRRRGSTEALADDDPGSETGFFLICVCIYVFFIDDEIERVFGSKDKKQDDVDRE